jgi:hypothetical protein
MGLSILSGKVNEYGGCYAGCSYSELPASISWSFGNPEDKKTDMNSVTLGVGRVS